MICEMSLGEEYAKFVEEVLTDKVIAAIKAAENEDDALDLFKQHASLKPKINKFCTINDCEKFTIEDDDIKDDFEYAALEICNAIRDEATEEDAEEESFNTDSEISDEKPITKSEAPKKAVAPRKATRRLEDTSDIETEAPTAKPSREKRATEAKPKTTKRGKELPMVEGVCDYKTMGLNTAIVNELIDAINALTEPTPIDRIPPLFEGDKIHYRVKKDLHYKLINIKLSSHIVAIKFEFSGYDDSGKTASKPASIKKFGNSETVEKKKGSVVRRTIPGTASDIDTIDDGVLPAGLMRILKAFKAYDLMFKETGKEIWRPEIDSILATDLVYKLPSMKFEGFMDTTRNIPLGPFKHYYKPEDSKEYEYRQIDYQTLFSYLRFGGKSFSKTTLDSAMKKIYKNRYPIIFHDKVEDLLDDQWKQARDELRRDKEMTPTKKRWLNILSSKQCANIILRGYPATTQFDEMMKELLSRLETKLLLKDVLFPISFIFSPFGVVLTEAPTAKEANHKQAMNQAIKIATLKCLDYKECLWAKLIIEDMPRTEKKEPFYLINYLQDRNCHIFEAAGKGDKSSDEDETEG